MGRKSTSTKNRGPRGTVTGVRKSATVLQTGRWFSEVEFRVDGKLRIEQFVGLTKYVTSRPQRGSTS